MKSLVPATSKSPCIHCGKGDWCYTLANSATVCKRGQIANGWLDSGKTDKDGAAILYPQEWGGNAPAPKVISTQEWIYPWRNMPKAPLVKVIRQNLDNGNKKIFQNFYNGKSWLKTRPKSLDRSEIPIYNLAKVREAIAQGQTIYIVEGEKCADLLNDLGLVATTNIGGCKGFSESDLQDLAGAKRIVLVPDYDKPGVELMQTWAKHLPNAEWLYPFPYKDWRNPPPSQGLDLFDWGTELKLKAPDLEAAIGYIPDSLRTAKVETSQPLTIPQRESSRIYGGEKDLKLPELVRFVSENIAPDLEFDDLRSAVLYKGKRLALGNDCKVWFYRTFEEVAGKEDIYDTIINFAKEKAFNPVQRYLEGVAKTSERVRIDNLAERYLGRPEPIYNRLVEMWLISAVARALDKGTTDYPGVQVDHTLILQSGQGKYKSTWFKVLGGAWFDDSIKDIESKDSLLLVHSNWIIELSELDRITSRKQAGVLKHWLTQKTDSFRKPYARETEPTLPRPCVFCGTVNPSRFLVDDENRRFWIVPVSESISEIDIPLVTRERDGIWAAAYDAYKAGAIWWPNEEEKQAISEINDQFRDVDAWQEPIEEWIRNKEYVSNYEILTELFQIEPGAIKRAEDMRIGKILNSLGWTKETRKNYLAPNGEKVFRKVRVNPSFIEKVGKVCKVGKDLVEKALQPYIPQEKVCSRYVEEKEGLHTLPTSTTDLTDPQTQSGQGVYIPTDLYTPFPNTTPESGEKKDGKPAGLLFSEDEQFRYMVNLEKLELAWTSEQLQSYCVGLYGVASWWALTPEQKADLVYKLRALRNELPDAEKLAS